MSEECKVVFSMSSYVGNTVLLRYSSITNHFKMCFPPIFHLKLTNLKLGIIIKSLEDKP